MNHLVKILLAAPCVFLSCEDAAKSDEPIKAVSSFIITDYAVSDTLFLRSVIMELDTTGVNAGSLPCNDDAGFIQLAGKDTINQVFDIIYGCKRTFQLISVEAPGYMHKNGCAYYKVDFTIYGNYDSDMIFRLYSDYLLGDWTVYFYDQINSRYAKSGDFKIRAFYFREERVLYE